MTFSCLNTASMPATPENAAVRQDEDILAPLIFFYGIGSTRPRVTFVEPEMLAEQERSQQGRARGIEAGGGRHQRHQVLAQGHEEQRYGSTDRVCASVHRQHPTSSPIHGKRLIGWPGR